MSWRVTMLIGIILLAGCTRPPIQSVTPLPPSTVMTPPADVPARIAAFSGVWVGQWTAGEVVMEHTLIVESIDKDGDSFLVRILFSHGDQPHWGYDDPGYFRTEGSIGADGKLRLKPLPNGARITYAMLRAGELSGELRLAGLTSYSTLLHPTRDRGGP
jgi:hypothetical protein